jgi:hypothetical protein
MKNKNFTTSYLVDQSPEEVYNAIINVRGWWGEGVKGNTEKLNDEFVYRHEPYHYSKHRLTEVIPGKKIVWLTIDGALSFVEHKTEWKGTKIIFEIAAKGKKTELRFTHEGLTPELECFDDCSNGWGHYVEQSLLKLITTGKGKPDKKEKSIPVKG